MYYVKWFPFRPCPFENCFFLDFPKKSSTSFDQVMSIVEGFPYWNKKLYSDLQHLHACEEEFMMYQDLSKKYSWKYLE